MQLRLFAPRYWPTWAGLGVLRLLALLPFPVLLATGRGLGMLLRRLPLRFVRTARCNIRISSPVTTGPSESTGSPARWLESTRRSSERTG